MAAENNLWQSLKPRLQKAGFFAQRIETTTNEGVPDVWIGWDGGYAWAELKAAKEWPKRDSTRVFGREGLSQEQINWHLGALARGVHVLIVAAVGVGHHRQTFAVPSSLCERFNEMTKAELMVWHCPIDNIPATIKLENKLCS